MIYSVAAGMTAIVAVALEFYSYWSGEQRLKRPLVTAGLSRKLDDPKVLLFLEYSRQQRKAFAVLWFTVTAGAILIITMLVRLVFARQMDLSAVATVSALTINVGVGAGAAKLYRDSSRRVEEAAKSLK